MLKDAEFDRVKTWLSDPQRLEAAGSAVRNAIDWVIDGPRTQRYSIEELNTTERIYIGNRVEHELLHQWQLLKQGPLDCVIEGSHVDIKFTIGKSWMIPIEAVGRICIVVVANDGSSTFSLGLLRARKDAPTHFVLPTIRRAHSLIGSCEP